MYAYEILAEASTDENATARRASRPQGDALQTARKGRATADVGENLWMRRALFSTVSSSRLAELLNQTRTGHSVLWMAPCAKSFKADTATSSGSTFVFNDRVIPELFAGANVPKRATSIVVSAQVVRRPFLQAWREAFPQEEKMMLVRRGTSLGSIDIDAAKELEIDVCNTPGVNSPHVAQFTVDALGLSGPIPNPDAANVVVVGTGSVGRYVVSLLESVGLKPIAVNRSPGSPTLQTALRGATHVAVCAATSGEPIITTEHVKELLAGRERAIKICSVSRPEAFSLDAIMLIAQHQRHVQLRFDYGDSILAPTRDQVNADGVKGNITWSSVAMASEACKQDMDEAVLSLLAHAGEH